VSAAQRSQGNKKADRHFRGSPIAAPIGAQLWNGLLDRLARGNTDNL